MSYHRLDKLRVHGEHKNNNTSLGHIFENQHMGFVDYVSFRRKEFKSVTTYIRTRKYIWGPVVLIVNQLTYSPVTNIVTTKQNAPLSLDSRASNY